MPGLILPLALALAGVPEGTPTFTVTISPEARVSVARVGPPPGLRACAEPVEIVLDVRNEAGLRRALAIRSPSPSIRIEDGGPLSGAAAERRILRVTLLVPDPVDAEFRFDVGAATGDLGWRSVGHLLLACTPTPAVRRERRS